LQWYIMISIVPITMHDEPHSVLPAPLHVSELSKCNSYPITTALHSLAAGIRINPSERQWELLGIGYAYLMTWILWQHDDFCVTEYTSYRPHHFYRQMSNLACKWQGYHTLEVGWFATKINLELKWKPSNKIDCWCFYMTSVGVIDYSPCDCDTLE
jgi:hypothetical protein